MSVTNEETVEVSAANAAAESSNDGITSLIDAQLDDIVCGGWSRISFLKTNPN